MMNGNETTVTPALTNTLPSPFYRSPVKNHELHVILSTLPTPEDFNTLSHINEQIGGL